MPELPEVETTRRGVAPHVVGRRITGVSVREPRLRWPVPEELAQVLLGQRIEAVTRRAKYLLFRTEAGTLMVHLGMSGSLRIVDAEQPPGRHAHIDVCVDDGRCLRYTDPRRFGSFHWVLGDPALHPLLAALGPEPLDPDRFTGDYLYRLSRGRKVAVKSFLMDSHVVVGVGNIYANEALFMTGIHPARPAGQVSLERYRRLADAVREVLGAAIEAGGTTLRDFTSSEGKPGYFRMQLKAYGRGGEPCGRCGAPLVVERIGQRAAYYCPVCQR
jgi:formamidopyrimidine-DNA glycosylase